MKLQAGDIVKRIPVTFYAIDKREQYKNADGTLKEPRECRVVYVHPLGRYHTVEFETPGGLIRESFKGVER